MKNFKAIAAMSENRVIGSDGDMPWNLPEDFKWFKEKTMGGILIMGRKTYESIGEPLPGRETYVLSRRSLDIPGVKHFTDIETLLQELETEKTVWIAGGAEIYRQTLPLCDEILLTRIHRQCEGDTFFPAFEDRFEFKEVIRENPDFTIERWEKIRGR